MKYSFLTIAVLSFILTGCGDAHPAPPLERNDLLVRFFRSLRNNDSASALRQGEKLYALEPKNYFVRNLVNIQQANNHVAATQGFLNTFQLAKAQEEIRRALLQFPRNTHLHQQRDLLNKLNHAETLLISMRSAPNAAAMESALVAAQAGFSGVESPGLRKFFSDYRKQITRWKASNKTISGQHGNKVPIRSFDDK